MKKILKKYFGYDEFMPFQEEIIGSVLDKKDTVAILPTGGGKSLCYQLPALKFKGLTLVLSPLISLMKDQVDALKENNIVAEYINSSLYPKEILEIQNRIEQGKVKILYVAPERLAMQNFQEFLQKINIELIAVDEAHCISEWGHDFRPDYRNLKCLKTLFPKTPIIALTATATPIVQKDIVKQLSLENAKIFIDSFNRKNLSFFILQKTANTAFNRLVNLLQEYEQGSAIIYCFSRRDTENIAENLQIAGFGALPYHAGLNNKTRKQTQDLFIKGKIPIIVATIAFGMGINKPDVRLVAHYSFPKSIEEYYQQIGRAGRDGLPSKCVMFYSYSDKIKHEYFISKIEDIDEKYKVQAKLNQIVGYCEQRQCRRKFLLEYFGEKFYKENCGSCDICLGY
ncbi:MAG: ATP-dependent DNA helicase RecQ [Patescibacteria group bacterium]|nr:ATP-dependent DNA helicase RecQ [Patescibacteria group bacterium]